MKITVAKGAGFCFGVRRAYGILEKALEERKSGERIFTLGSFVHNPHITEELAGKGVYITDEASLERLYSEANETAPVTILLRTHGISKQLKKTVETYSEKNPWFRSVDCTCPCVLNIHRIVERETAIEPEKTVLLVYGDKEHPEVEAIVSYAQCRYEVFNTLEELEALDLEDKRVVMVQQTTQLITNCKLYKEYLDTHLTGLMFYGTI